MCSATFSNASLEDTSLGEAGDRNQFLIKNTLCSSQNTKLPGYWQFPSLNLPLQVMIGLLQLLKQYLAINIKRTQLLLLPAP